MIAVATGVVGWCVGASVIAGGISGAGKSHAVVAVGDYRRNAASQLSAFGC